MSNHKVDDQGGDELEIEEGSRKGRSPQAVKEGSGKVQKASAYAKLWNCNAKREMMMRLRKVHGKVFHRRR